MWMETHVVGNIKQFQSRPTGDIIIIEFWRINKILYIKKHEFYIVLALATLILAAKNVKK